MGKFIIAIDGTAASGKGTLAQLLAKHYKLDYLDTGLSYRAVAYILLQQKSCDSKQQPAEQPAQEAIIEVAQNLDLSKISPKFLRSHDIGQAASKIAIYPALRKILCEKQRAFAKAAKAGAILDGRDIGTVVCPDANIKLYIDANIETRAARRFAQLQATGSSIDFAAVLKDLQFRDHNDKTRKSGALKQAKDALLIDNSKLSIEQCVLQAKEIIDPVINACRALEKDIYKKN